MVSVTVASGGRELITHLHSCKTTGSRVEILKSRQTRAEVPESVTKPVKVKGKEHSAQACMEGSCTKEALR